MDNKTTTDSGSVRMVPVSSTDMDRLQDLSIHISSFLKVGPERVIMSSFFTDLYSKYENFPVYQDDTWVVTYPKSGTTWTQELVWCLINDPKSPEAKLELKKRFPFFEFDSLISLDLDTTDIRKDDPMCPGNTWHIVQNLSAPRTIKSHLPKELLPKQIWQVKPKIVYVCRDPRDVCVSYYYHYIREHGYKNTFNHFVQLLLDDIMVYTPFWLHILNFWKMRHEDHILFLRYEDMKKDLAAVVRQVAAFLGRDVNEEQVSWLTHHCSFEEMSKNPAVNHETLRMAPTQEAKAIKFMRKGKVGDWRNHLTEEQQKAFKQWTLKYLQGTDFPYYQDYE
nr:luciferin sulfotransferase-like isoform X3 [Cherax quadricarinatus]